MVNTATANIRLYNDETHSQKEVLLMLLSPLMGHTLEQAIQCITLIERKGSYTIREGMEKITNAIDIVGVLKGMGFKVELEYN